MLILLRGKTLYKHSTSMHHERKKWTYFKMSWGRIPSFLMLFKSLTCELSMLNCQEDFTMSSHYMENIQ